MGGNDKVTEVEKILDRASKGKAREALKILKGGNGGNGDNEEVDIGKGRFSISEELQHQGNVSLIPPSLIDPNPNNTRNKSRLRKIPELAASIKEYGQKDAAIVYKSGDRYMLISGERRWRACIRGGIAYLICIVIAKPADEDLEYQEIALHNFGGEPLTHMEKARECQRLLNIELKKGISLSEARKKVGVAVGCSDTSVSCHIDLLKLPLEIQERLEPDAPKNKRIAYSKAVQLAKLPNQKEMLATMREVVKTGMRVAQVRARVEKKQKEHGITIPQRTSRPGDNYDILRSFIRVSNHSLDNFDVWGQEGFCEIFANRKDSDVVNADLALKNIADRIASLRKIVVKSR